MQARTVETWQSPNGQYLFQIFTADNQILKGAFLKHLGIEENRYFISVDGIIYDILKRTYKPRWINNTDKAKGYMFTQFQLGDYKWRPKIHQLVMQTFNANPEESSDDDDSLVIDHIDRNHFNNHFSNLRYVSVSENNRNRRTDRSVDWMLDKHKEHLLSVQAFIYKDTVYIEGDDGRLTPFQQQEKND